MDTLLEFGSRSGPKTVVCLFPYGGVHHATVNAILEDIGKASYICGRAERCNETLKAQGVPPVASDWPVSFTLAPQDALISRARSAMASRFLEHSDADVLIMLDHDLWWVPPSKDYEGDLLHIARQCADTRSIVGAAVSKKVRGQGIASMLKRDGEFQFGCEAKLEPTWYLGSAFTAYHRDVLKAVADNGYLYGKHVSEQKLEQVAPGFKPMFMEMVVKHPMDEKVKLHLSEDWAFCHRARELGYETFISCKPLVVHFGEYGFQVVRDSPPELPPANVDSNTVVTADQHNEALAKAQPVFSLLHATRGRPDLARKAAIAWAEKCTEPGNVEYIASADDDDETMADWTPPELRGMSSALVVGPSRGCVDAYNRAYAKSRGRVLIQMHDDLEPPDGWDEAVLKAFDYDTDKPVALHVDDGLPESVNRNPDLMSLAIVTRPFAEKLGGLFYPEYVSVYCDDDLTQFAMAHGYRKEAKQLVFRHAWGGNDRDATQKRSYDTKNWKQGKELLKRRRGQGFPEAAGGDQ